MYAILNVYILRWPSEIPLKAQSLGSVYHQSPLQWSDFWVFSVNLKLWLRLTFSYVDIGMGWSFWYRQDHLCRWNLGLRTERLRNCRLHFCFPTLVILWALQTDISQLLVPWTSLRQLYFLFAAASPSSSLLEEKSFLDFPDWPLFSWPHCSSLVLQLRQKCPFTQCCNHSLFITLFFCNKYSSEVSFLRNKNIPSPNFLTKGPVANQLLAELTFAPPSKLLKCVSLRTHMIAYSFYIILTLILL